MTEVDQLGRKLRQSLYLPACKSVVDGDVSTLDVTEFTQALSESVDFRGRSGREVKQKTDARHSLRLLRARCKRPRDCGAAESGDELAALHSITSSAVQLHISDTVSPSASAVLRQ